MKKLLVVLMVMVVVVAGVLIIRRVIRGRSFRGMPVRQTENFTSQTNNPAATAAGSIDDELKQLDDLMSKDNTADLNPGDITNLSQ